MAAQVSSFVQYVNNNNNNNSNGYEDDKSNPITQDLLGIGFNITSTSTSTSTSNNSNQNQELDLDLEVPKGWEKRLDLKSGKVYLQRCSSSSSPPKRRTTTTSSSSGGSNSSLTSQDLNFPPSSLSKYNTLNLNLFDDASLDLKLRSASATSSSFSFSAGNNSNNYQSVCTLDKVKSALERAEKEPTVVIVKKPSPIWKSSSSLSSSSSSSSTPLSSFREEDNATATAIATDNNKKSSQSQCHPQSQVAAGCPSCLLYVLISSNDPKCPRCNAHVPLRAVKKPRIDLNISI